MNTCIRECSSTHGRGAGEVLRCQLKVWACFHFLRTCRIHYLDTLRTAGFALKSAVIIAWVKAINNQSHYSGREDWQQGSSYLYYRGAQKPRSDGRGSPCKRGKGYFYTLPASYVGKSLCKGRAGEEELAAQPESEQGTIKTQYPSLPGKTGSASGSQERFKDMQIALVEVAATGPRTGCTRQAGPRHPLLKADAPYQGRG